MDVRLTPRVLTREEQFGGICYVPHRDDFFAANSEVYNFIKKLPQDWEVVDNTIKKAVVSLARLGICETRSPQTRERSYSGPSFLGRFQDIPKVREPLVVNCFCTAHCPLRCLYCHADDLMNEFRDSESNQDLDNVASTASAIRAIVAVITGGDPLTKPERANRLIEKLSAHKRLVLDTSGVGNIGDIVDSLKEHNVHIRISLDAISETNDRVRPPNTIYASGMDASRTGAAHTISTCLKEGIFVTVQTVISSQNEDVSELKQLRDMLARWGVRNWVLHIAVKGGKARQIQEASEKKHIRLQGILPSRDLVHSRIRNLIDYNDDQKHPLDIRCTDTDNTPNSVLLVGSKGHLYTEGLAHNGKVKLFDASEGHPERVRSSFHNFDEFGHARRYLNWSPFLSPGKNLEDLCYAVPLPAPTEDVVASVIETESKFPVTDVDLLQELLSTVGFEAGVESSQRDEYYDLPGGKLAELDFVVRLRAQDGSHELCLKGPRFQSDGPYSRIELEFPPKSEESARETFTKNGLSLTWYFEKRRTPYHSPSTVAAVFLDQIPDLGYFIEIEGPLDQIREIAKKLSPALGDPETRNYKELYVDSKIADGFKGEDIRGAEFVK